MANIDEAPVLLICENWK